MRREPSPFESENLVSAPSSTVTGMVSVANRGQVNAVSSMLSTWDTSPMTTPNPGWYADPDPSNAGGQRYWDGGQWTQHSTPGTPRPTPPLPTPGLPESKGGGNRGLMIVLAIAAVVILAVGIGSVFGSDEEEGGADQASAPSSELPAATTHHQRSFKMSTWSPRRPRGHPCAQLWGGSVL